MNHRLRRLERRFPATCPRCSGHGHIVVRWHRGSGRLPPDTPTPPCEVCGKIGFTAAMGVWPPESDGWRQFPHLAEMVREQTGIDPRERPPSEGATP